MDIITQAADLNNLSDNIFSGILPASFVNSSISFRGKNNILFCEEGVHLSGCKINFNGDNSVMVLRKSRHKYSVVIDIFNNSSVFFGRDNYFNNVMHISISESQNLIVGDTCVFSFGTWIRTSDAHLIYSSSTMKRTNFSKSVLIGDHVWLGQDALILKNSRIGSGSIIAARGVVAGKRIPSNTSWGGNPVKMLGEDLFWDGSCVHNWDAQKTEQNISFSSDKYIFQKDNNQIIFEEFDKSLLDIKSAQDKLNFISDTLMKESKNRFYIENDFSKNPKEQKKLLKFFK